MTSFFVSLLHQHPSKPFIIRTSLVKIFIFILHIFSFILIKHSLGLYVTGMELNLRLREAPILSALRLRVPDSWLNKFSEENPHLLK